ncbi:hypothetical protein EVAR_3329_1 [Eumeta japonica]|uniref:Uncharacterized protein n=1 Tax=Eumeta variegata TaxID=151549 RepID=A0A4C1SVY7_EUMVA|nr:hypothetical protein EVAR_3329_1 [Eumeta japonica]
MPAHCALPAHDLGRCSYKCRCLSHAENTLRVSKTYERSSTEPRSSLQRNHPSARKLSQGIDCTVEAVGPLDNFVEEGRGVKRVVLCKGPWRVTSRGRGAPPRPLRPRGDVLRAPRAAFSLQFDDGRPSAVACVGRIRPQAQSDSVRSKAVRTKETIATRAEVLAKLLGIAVLYSRSGGP